jgi:tRNA pseudouridine38-40 synthase
MTRWKITVEYDGSGFCGWQRQADVLAVQQVIEEAIQKFSSEIVTLYVAGRTDAGVHAFGNVAHFDLQKDTTGDVVRDALNFHVKPHLISIIEAEAVAEDFHARFQAQERQYLYRIINRRAPLALETTRAWHVPRPLDVDAMNNVAQLLQGEHDFSTFRAHYCQSKSPIKTIDEIKLVRNNEEIAMTVRARSFLYHQVRNIIGTLVYVGTGRWTLEDFNAAFAARDRRAGGPTAPPQGLYFVKVSYPQTYPQTILKS